MGVIGLFFLLLTLSSCAAMDALAIWALLHKFVLLNEPFLQQMLLF